LPRFRFYFVNASRYAAHSFATFAACCALISSSAAAILSDHRCILADLPRFNYSVLQLALVETIGFLRTNGYRHLPGEIREIGDGVPRVKKLIPVGANT
jgi:hypothetical protein